MALPVENVVPIPRLSDEGVKERMFALIEKERPDGDFKVAEIVSKVMAFLHENDPDVLERFAELMIRETLVSFYRRKLTARRRSLRRSALEAQFRLAMEDVEERQNWFEQVYSIDNDNTMRAVSEMTGADHKFVATRYQASGQRDLLLASFHRRIADVCGTQRTVDAMSEAEYERMFRVVVRMEDEWEL